MTNSEIIDSLKSKLKSSRLKHSLSVAETARELALLYGADADKAYLAGIVHDCAKCYTDDELYDKLMMYNISVDDISYKNPKLLHAYVGAHEARLLYGIEDDEILDAVYYHTIGKADMPRLCAVVYLADAIEPLRSYEGVGAIRDKARTSLEQAVLMYTEMSMAFLMTKGEYIHPNALETRNYYLRFK